MREMYYSLDRKVDHLRAVHLREGPLGKFIYHALKFDATILSITPSPNNTVEISMLMEDTFVDQFEQDSGFGLQE